MQHHLGIRAALLPHCVARGYTQEPQPSFCGSQPRGQASGSRVPLQLAAGISSKRSTQLANRRELRRAPLPPRADWGAHQLALRDSSRIPERPLLIGCGRREGGIG